MKQNKKYSWFLFLTIAGASSGTLTAQNRQTAFNVQQVSMTKWSSPDGLPYVEAPGINMGATSFEVIADNKVAFLSNASNEIIITNKTTGKVINKFPVSFAPRDFAFDKGLFYVLDEQMVAVYNQEGKSVTNLLFPNSYLGVERVARYNNVTYLLLPSGNSFKIEANKEVEGWITSTGNLVLTKLNDEYSYSFKVTTAEGKSFEKIVKTDKTVAGVYVVGSTNNRIFLDVQKYISQEPITVEREIVAIELSASGLGKIASTLKVPDCYYVLSNNDFHVTANNSILNMVTTPQGAFVFTLTEVNSTNAKSYPASLSARQYHFNDHLIQAEAK